MHFLGKYAKILKRARLDLFNSWNQGLSPTPHQMECSDFVWWRQALKLLHKGMWWPLSSIHQQLPLFFLIVPWTIFSHLAAETTLLVLVVFALLEGPTSSTSLVLFVGQLARLSSEGRSWLQYFGLYEAQEPWLHFNAKNHSSVHEYWAGRFFFLLIWAYDDCFLSLRIVVEI